MKSVFMIVGVMVLVVMVTTSVPSATAQDASTPPTQKASPSNSKTAVPSKSATARTPLELVPEADAETRERQTVEIQAIDTQAIVKPAIADAKGAFTAPIRVPSTSCGSYTVEQALQWCAGDHGTNEGALCGASYLHVEGASPFGVVISPALANTWDRTNMVDAAATGAKAAKASGWKTGPGDLAVAAAICCQAHNPPVAHCLLNHREAVWNWLIAR
jgi:hypothetical protein